MKKLTIDTIPFSEISEFYQDIYELACYLKDDDGGRGWNCFLRKDYIQGYLNDVKSDIKSGMPVDDKLKRKLEFMENLVNNMQGELLMIDHGDFKY